MPGVKTNEAPGTRAVLRHYRMSAYKARQVLDLVRGKDVDRADEILRSIPREAARVVAKVLASAVANARNNDQLDPEDLFVSACFADEGTTLKRWRPRARGRATRIRKRTCHITVIVSRLPEDRLERRRARDASVTSGLRSRRVAASRRGAERPADDATDTEAPTSEAEELDATDSDVLEERGDEIGTDQVTDEVEVDEVETDDDAEARAELPVEADADTDTEADAEEEPAPKPKRARAARKRTTKGSADDGGAGEVVEEEKG
jgi:large subunit ribosomal protein L22